MLSRHRVSQQPAGVWAFTCIKNILDVFRSSPHQEWSNPLYWKGRGCWPCLGDEATQYNAGRAPGLRTAGSDGSRQDTRPHLGGRDADRPRPAPERSTPCDGEPHERRASRPQLVNPCSTPPARPGADRAPGAVAEPPDPAVTAPDRSPPTCRAPPPDLDPRPSAARVGLAVAPPYRLARPTAGRTARRARGSTGSSLATAGAPTIDRLLPLSARHPLPRRHRHPYCPPPPAGYARCAVPPGSRCGCGSATFTPLSAATEALAARPFVGLRAPTLDFQRPSSPQQIDTQPSQPPPTR